MKFDVLAESIIRNINEGRLSKAEKYSGIDFDSDKFKELVDSKSLDSEIESKILSQKGLVGLPKEKLDEILNKIADDFSEVPPQTFEEFKEQLTSIVDDFFKERGPRRAVYVARLAKSIGNVILDKNTGVVSSAERASSPSSHKEERMSDKEEAIINHIYSSDEPTKKEDIVDFVAHTFAKEEDEAEQIINDLISDGKLSIDDEGIVTAGNEDESSEEDLEVGSEGELSDLERKIERERLETSTGEEDEDDEFTPLDSSDEEEEEETEEENENVEDEDEKPKKVTRREYNDEEEDDNALLADRDIEDIFRRTIGHDRDYESSNY